MRDTMMKVRQAKSPVKRLDARIAAMERRVTALKELKPALATLYSSLSEADELLTGDVGASAGKVANSFVSFNLAGYVSCKRP